MPELEYAAALTLAQTRERVAGTLLPFEVARVYSQHVRLRAGQDRLPTWTPAEFEARFADVVTLIDAADEARASSAEWRPSYKRAAELLEWLDHPAVNLLRLPLGLLGAACYSLAGLPARAMTLAAPPVRTDQDAPLLRLLLRGDFPSLLVEAADAASTRPLSTSSGNGSWSHADWYSLVLREIGAALGVVAADFRWGNEDRREVALDKLRIAANAMRNLADPYSWLLMKLASEVAREMVDSSLRIPLAGLAQTASADGGGLAFEGYARARFLDRRSLAWPSQTRGLTKLTLNESFALCTPTGSGKTTVAEVALLDGLFREAAPLGGAALCLYIVPTRALAAEVEAKLSQAMRRSQRGRPVTVTGLYGGTNWGPSDTWLSSDEPTVLICTQEKADALVRYLGWGLASRLSLIVIDEAHEVAAPEITAQLLSGESRPLRLETLIARLRARLPPSTRFIAMSAVAGDIDRPLAQWVTANLDAVPVESNYRTTRQVVGRLQCRNRWTRIVYDVLDGTPLRVGRTASEAFVPTPFPRAPEAEDMSGPQKALAPYAMWAAANLASGTADSPGQSVLISVAWQVRNFAKWALTLLDQWETVIPSFFVPPTDEETIALWNTAQRACDDYFGPGSTEGKLIRRGVLVYYGRMPGRLPRLMVQLAERRALRIVIATSGLSQGVNLPFETVLVPILRRQDGAMARSEFWNLVGRAGRPGVSTEGQTLVLINEDDRTEWRRQRVLSDYNQLTRLADETLETTGSPLGNLLTTIRQRWARGTDADFDEWLERTAPLQMPEPLDDATLALDALDGVLLAAIEDSPDDRRDDPAGVEVALRSFWQATFSRYAHPEEARLESILLQRGQAIRGLYADPALRRRIYLTSLPPRDAVRLEEVAARLRVHLETGRQYARWARADQLQYVLTAVEILAAHPRFAPRATVGNTKRTWSDVLSWWLLGWDAEVAPTVAQAGPWHDFINNYFTYRFNWALGSALSLMAAGEEREAPAINLPEWPQTGLPWIALWIKDLLEWGTLDPVAAFLLARAGFATRPDAEEEAAAYYESEEASGQTDPLAPDAISLWARRRTKGPTGGDGHVAPSRFPAEVASDLPVSAFDRSWSVIPAASPGRPIRWLDPSGRLLAVSEPHETWGADWSQVFDYELQPAQRVVVSTRYI